MCWIFVAWFDDYADGADSAMDSMHGHMCDWFHVINVCADGWVEGDPPEAVML